MTNDLKDKFCSLDKHDVHDGLINLMACQFQLHINLRDISVTFVGVNEQTIDIEPRADTLRDVLLMSDLSLRSVMRATFLSRTCCAGVNLFGFEGRTLRVLEWDK
jgi:hypothetical protein